MNTQRMPNTIIKLENVSLHQRDYEVFNNISLAINSGEFIYLIGETGGGKSSLLKAFYGEIKASSGKITVCDMNLNKITTDEIPILRRKLGIVFQDFQLLTDRNIFNNLSFVLESTGWTNKKRIISRINQVLESVHLSGVKEKMPHELSGGEQQRASIARALLNTPEIILADEPTGNLDPIKSEKIIELLKEINAKGTTIIIATHDYQVIKKFNARTIKCIDQKIREIEPNEL